MDGINYFKIGWQHIISWDALDHILFTAVLAAIYLVKDWKQVLVLVTAFTIGHSVTLFLSVKDIVRFNSHLVEVLIAATIMLTALFNVLIKNYRGRALRLNYLLALVFGLIHGMGYANAIRFELPEDEGILWPLLQFNLGLEAGQIAVVLLILGLSYLLVNRLMLKRKWWVWGLSAIAFSVALKMFVERVMGN